MRRNGVLQMLLFFRIYYPGPPITTLLTSVTIVLVSENETSETSFLVEIGVFKDHRLLVQGYT